MQTVIRDHRPNLILANSLQPKPLNGYEITSTFDIPYSIFEILAITYNLKPKMVSKMHGAKIFTLIYNNLRKRGCILQ